MFLSRLGSATLVSFGLVVLACSHAAPPGPEAAPSSPIAADPASDAGSSVMAASNLQTVASDLAVDASTMASGNGSSAPDAATGPDFSACAADSDCVAVKKNACCNHGELEAVAASSAKDYKASFKCAPPRPMCPMFIKVDGRVAICDASTQHCAMAAPSDISCGAGAGARKCPSGLHCGADNKCTK